MSKLICPAYNNEYTKSLSPLGKTWYDCLKCSKTKEDLEKEFKKPSLEKLKEAQAVLKKIHEKEPSDEILEIISQIEDGDFYYDDDGSGYVYSSVIGWYTIGEAVTFDGDSWTKPDNYTYE